MSENGLKEQITGKVEKTKGQVKEGIGEVTEDRKLKMKGSGTRRRNDKRKSRKSETKDK